jgi:hypothetical protein
VLSWNGLLRTWDIGAQFQDCPSHSGTGGNPTGDLTKSSQQSAMILVLTQLIDITFMLVFLEFIFLLPNLKNIHINRRVFLHIIQ